MVDQRFVDQKAEEEATNRARETAENWKPAFTPEQLATPPSWIPPLETEEAREAREAQGLPEPRRPGTSGPLMTTRDMRQGDVRTQDTEGRQAKEREDRERQERERQEREHREAVERQQQASQEPTPKRPAR